MSLVDFAYKGVDAFRDCSSGSVPDVTHGVVDCTPIQLSIGTLLGALPRERCEYRRPLVTEGGWYFVYRQHVEVSVGSTETATDIAFPYCESMERGTELLSAPATYSHFVPSNAPMSGAEARSAEAADPLAC